MKQRADNSKNLKPFVKGDDPRRNLKGQPPKLPELQPLLDKVLGEQKGNLTAMEGVIKALLAKAAKGDVRAAEVLLNRAYGQAKQILEAKHTVTVENLSLEQAKQRAKELNDAV